MNTCKLGQIMMKWSLENKVWDMVLILYRMYNVSIPNKYIYKLPQKKIYLSAMDAINTKDISISSKNPHLRKLLLLFPQSRWRRLKEWGDSYGYSYN